MSYRHILVPTDGSSRSRAAAVAAVALARALGARITGLFVVAEIDRRAAAAHVRHRTDEAA
jgi:nucleotide-binding universal stress UspA family protein